MFRTIVSIVSTIVLLGSLAAAIEPQSSDKKPPTPIYIPASMVIEPGAVQGGQSANMTVTMSGVSTVDQLVTIETDHPEVFSSIPSTVVVPAGNLSTTFTVVTVTVGGPVPATITALSGVGQSAGTLTVNP